MKTISAILKFILGVLFAFSLLLAGSVAAARYFITKMTTPPPKPIFANDRPTSTTQSAIASPSAPAAATPQEAPPAAKPSPKPLPDGAYEARVSWPDGLILRDGSGADANRVGGLAYNEKVIVVEESGEWQKVRLSGSEKEGWVKAGNLERTN